MPKSTHELSCAGCFISHEEWGLTAKLPKLKLSKELGRTLRLDQEAERKLLAAADVLQGDRQSCRHAHNGARQSLNRNEVSTSRTWAGTTRLERDK